MYTHVTSTRNIYNKQEGGMHIVERKITWHYYFLFLANNTGYLLELKQADQKRKRLLTVSPIPIKGKKGKMCMEFKLKELHDATLKDSSLYQALIIPFCLKNHQITFRSIC